MVCCTSEYRDFISGDSDKSDNGLLGLRRLFGRCDGVGVIGGGLPLGDGCSMKI